MDVGVDGPTGESIGESRALPGRRRHGDGDVRVFFIEVLQDTGLFHTAERIAARTGHEIITDPRLRERHLGLFQGLTREEAREKHPQDSDKLDSGDPDYKIPGGESARERYERMVACIEEIAAHHPGERIVIVSHGGALRSLFYRTVGIPLSAPRAFKLFHASINRFYFENGQWKLATWGDISHLHGLDTIDDW